MRLISQNGMVDVLYENVCISINYRNKNQITAWNFGCKDYEIVTMATYSNTDKALKVMEMLREQYMRNNALYIDRENNARVIPQNSLFKFPADEEIEV